eukprot:sb/3473267/
MLPHNSKQCNTIQYKTFNIPLTFIVYIVLEVNGSLLVTRSLLLERSRDKNKGTKVFSVLALVGVGAGINYYMAIATYEKSRDKTEGTKMISVLELVGVAVGSSDPTISCRYLSPIPRQCSAKLSLLNVCVFSKPFLSGYSHVFKKRLCANLII